MALSRCAPALGRSIFGFMKIKSMLFFCLITQTQKPDRNARHVRDLRCVNALAFSFIHEKYQIFQAYHIQYTCKYNIYAEYRNHRNKCAHPMLICESVVEQRALVNPIK